MELREMTDVRLTVIIILQCIKALHYIPYTNTTLYVDSIAATPLKGFGREESRDMKEQLAEEIGPRYNLGWFGLVWLNFFTSRIRLPPQLCHI